MNLISQLIADGGIFAIILGLMFLEACILVPYHLLSGQGIAPGELILTLASGGSLLLAMLAVILKAPLLCVAAALCMALLAHLADLAHRWRTSSRQPLARQWSHAMFVERTASVSVNKSSHLDNADQSREPRQGITLVTPE